MIERVARAIYDANDELSGDPIGVVIVASEHLFPQRSHMEGNSSSKAYQLAAMDICRSAARAAIEALVEPTPEMKAAGAKAIGNYDLAHDAYVEMLRTSLTGDTK